MGMVTHPDPEVRKAALDALMQLGDTNAIPGLEDIVKEIQDPREKVAMMDAIQFLKLPDFDSVVPDRMPDAQAEASATIHPRKGRPSSQIKSGWRPKNDPRAAYVPPRTAPANPGQP